MDKHASIFACQMKPLVNSLNLFFSLSIIHTIWNLTHTVALQNSYNIFLNPLYDSYESVQF